MWHLTQIPKVAHFYWSGQVLPWVRFLTLDTFRYHNPDWKMVVWTSEKQSPPTQPIPDSENFWSRVENLNVERRPIDIEKHLGLNWSALDTMAPELRIVHAVDLFSWWLLWTQGGFWCNMDVLHFKPLEQGFFNQPGCARFQVFTLPSPYNNFLMSVPGSSFFKRVFDTAMAVPVEDISKDFSSTGPIVYERVMKEAPLDDVLQILLQTTEVFGDDLKGKEPLKSFKLPDYTIAVHWHGAGLSDSFIAITPETVRHQQPQTLMTQLIGHALALMGR